MNTRVLIVVLLLSVSVKMHSQTYDLTVTVNNIKEKKGVIRLFLWDDAEGFPKEKGKFFRADSLIVASDSVRIVFRNIPEGVYAVSLFQDTNDNKEFDRNRFTRTAEPFGLSGKPDFRERPVKFEDCSFIVSNDNKQINISLLYVEDLEIYR